MALTNVFGSLSRFGSHSASKGKVVEHALDTVGVAAGAFAPAYLAAKSRVAAAKAGKTDGGELMGVPYTLLSAVVLGAAGLAGVGGRNSHHLLNAAKGSMAAYAATQAIKMAWEGSGQAPSLGALPAGKNWALSGMYQFGATPETENLFREAGL